MAYSAAIESPRNPVSHTRVNVRRAALVNLHSPRCSLNVRHVSLPASISTSFAARKIPQAFPIAGPAPVTAPPTVRRPRPDSLRLFRPDTFPAERQDLPNFPNDDGFPQIFLAHCPFGCGKSGNSLYGFPGFVDDLVTNIIGVRVSLLVSYSFRLTPEGVRILTI